MSALTPRQRDLLAYIEEYTKRAGHSPSFDEMREALALHSKSGIHRLISALEERGFIRRIPNRARCIEIVTDQRLPSSLARYPVEALAFEAERRGLKLGRTFVDAAGTRRFEAISA